MLRWFKEVFLLETEPQIHRLWGLLVLDAASTHINEESIDFAISKNVWILYLPSHSSGLTQPLDVAVFGPLKVAYCREIQKWAGLAANATISKQRFLAAFKIAHSKATTRKNISLGIEAAGIYPSTTAHVFKRLRNIQRLKPQPPPITPTKKRITQDLSYSETPSSSKDLYSQLKPLQQALHRVSRGVNTTIRKVGVALDKKNAEITTLTAQKHQLKQELASTRPTKRTRVEKGPNRIFYDHLAMEEAKEKAGINTQVEPGVEPPQRLLLG